MRFGLALVLAGLAAAGLVWFATRNTLEVPVDLVFSVYPLVPLWAVVLGSVSLGAALAIAAFTFPVVRLRIQRRRQTRRIAELEQEVHGLRTLPVTGDSERTKTGALEV